MSAEVTAVVFRKWPKSEGGDVLALFPEIASDASGYQCLSYQHIGQHGGADYDLCIRATKAAKPAEYAELKRELERVGYNLRLIQRASPVHRAKRLSMSRQCSGPVGA